MSEREVRTRQAAALGVVLAAVALVLALWDSGHLVFVVLAGLGGFAGWCFAKGLIDG